MSHSVPDRESAEEGAAQWILRRSEGRLNATAEAEFAAWLADCAGHRAAYYRLNAAWSEIGRLTALRSAAPAKVVVPARTAYRLHRPFWAYALAASVLMGIALATGLLLSRGAPTDPNRFATAIGGLAAVPMTDGSKITLNTDSAIHIALSQAERHVDLERGEAFFEVAKDPSRPFVVQAGNKRVIAVGTEFSVRHQGDGIQVVVLEGRVRVEQADGHNAAQLTAGSVASASEDGLLVQKEQSADIEQNLSWRSGFLTFRDTRLAAAAAEFNRYNARKLVIDDAAVAQIEVGGIFRATNLEPFVRLLEQGFPVRVTETSDRIILSRATSR